MNKPIPEDLTALHHEAKTSYSLQCYRGKDVFPLIERIGRVEQERNQLRATRLEDALTISNQRTLLDKYDADNTALVLENDRLKERAKPSNVIVCCAYCGDKICKESEWVPKVAEHMAECAKNPVLKMAVENEKLKVQVERLSAELLEPARQCENCEEYYAESVITTTEDDVPLCPKCYKACAEDMESLGEEQSLAEKEGTRCLS